MYSDNRWDQVEAGRVEPRPAAVTVAAADPEPEPRSWAPEVIADASGKWTGNGLRFASKEAAEAWVADLSCRWTLVLDTRVVPSQDEPNR